MPKTKRSSADNKLFEQIQPKQPRDEGWDRLNGNENEPGSTHNLRPRTEPQPQNATPRWNLRSKSAGSSADTSTSSNAENSNTYEEELLENEDSIVDDPVEILKLVFFDLVIDDITNLSPGFKATAMANYIIENIDKFPKKPTPKVEVPQEELEPTFVSLDDALARDSNFKPKLIDAFIEDFRIYFAMKCKRRHDVIYDKELCNRLLHQHFPYCRTPLIDLLVDEFNGRYLLAAWICFFVESGRAYLLRQCINCYLFNKMSSTCTSRTDYLHIDRLEWICMSNLLPIPRKRRANWIACPEEGPIADSVREFHSEMRRFRADYDQIFCHDKDRLLPNAQNYVAITEENEFECIVCTGVFGLERAIQCCSILQANFEGQCSSSQQMNHTNETHKFCVECLVGHAKAATQEMPLAKGGIGLPCMAGDCANAILFSECRFYIPPHIRRQINARIVEENLGAANLPNLERCNECNFAICMEATFMEIRVFSCLKCKAAHCRECQRPWNDWHFGKKCNEMLTLKEEKQRAYENKLSEAIIRRCHRCSTPFMKDIGCNRMRCRCGATQCYICRAKDINYTHFCQHFRTPSQKNCKQCKKRCLLWQSEEEVDTLALEKVYQETEEADV